MPAPLILHGSPRAPRGRARLRWAVANALLGWCVLAAADGAAELTPPRAASDLLASATGIAAAASATAVPGDTIAPGQERTGALATTASRDSFYIVLAAGDRIDVAIWAAAGSPLDPALEIVRPGGQRVPAQLRRTEPVAGAIVAAFDAASSGVHTIVVAVAPGGAAGLYRLTSRAAGSIIAGSLSGPRVRYVPASAAAAVGDTIWIHNAGRGSAGYAVSTDAPWLTVTPATGMVARAPLEPATVALLTRRSAAGLAIGEYAGTITVSLPDDPWGGPLVERVALRVYDPSLVIAATGRLPATGMTGGTDGALRVLADRHLQRFEPATRTLTMLRTLLVDGCCAPAGMTLDPAGRLLVGDHAGVLEVPASGAPVRVLGTGAQVTGVAVLPDGTLYAAVGDALLRRRPTGAVDAVWTSGGGVAAVAYDPSSRTVWFSDGGALRRLNVATGAITSAGQEGSAIVALEASRTARLYMRTGAALVVFGPNHAEERRVPLPIGGTTLALLEGAVYVAGAAADEPLFRLPVADGPLGLYLQPGDSASRRQDSSSHPDTFRLALRAGDVVDIGAFAALHEDSFDPSLALFSPTGEPLAASRWDHRVERAAIIPRFTAPAPGLYLLRVGGTCCGAERDYVLKARPAGPVVEVHESRVWPRTFAGASEPVDATVLVTNAGQGTASFSATGAVPWLTVEPAAGTVVADGTGVEVRIRVDASGLEPGWHPTEVRVRLTDDDWAARDVVVEVLVEILDPVYVFPPGVPGGGVVRDIAAHPDGGLVLGEPNRLYRLDPGSGAVMPLSQPLSDSFGINVTVAPDGIVYFSHLGTLYRLNEDGQPVVVAPLGSIRGLHAAPGGTIYLAMSSHLVRRDADGTITHVVQTIRGGAAIVAVTGSLADGTILFSDSALIRRLDPATGAVTTVATAPGPVRHLEAGRTGVIYFHTGPAPLAGGGGRIGAFSPAGEPLWQHYAHGPITGLALAEGRLFGVRSAGGANLFYIPVDDGPVHGIWGDSSGDGVITAADALRCLTGITRFGAPPACKVAPDPDGRFTLPATALDALVILSHVVGRDTSAFRVGRSMGN